MQVRPLLPAMKGNNAYTRYMRYFLYIYALTVHNRHLHRINLHGFDNIYLKFVAQSTPMWSKCNTQMQHAIIGLSSALLRRTSADL